jgi:translation initiation factor SUI1
LPVSTPAHDAHSPPAVHRLANFRTERNGRKTLTTVQGLPKKFDQKKILKVIKKKFACNGTIVTDAEMGEVVQLQGDQRKDVQDFLTDKKEGLGLDAKTIKVSQRLITRCVEWCADEKYRSTVSKLLATATCLRKDGCFDLLFGLAWQLSRSTTLGSLASRGCEEDSARQARGRRTDTPCFDMHGC